MQIVWYGHSTFKLMFDGKTVLIDPFFTGNPAFEGDAAKAWAGATHILVTHGHGDHVGDAVAISKATGAPVATPESGSYLPQENGDGLSRTWPSCTGSDTRNISTPCRPKMATRSSPMAGRANQAARRLLRFNRL